MRTVARPPDPPGDDVRPQLTAEQVDGLLCALCRYRYDGDPAYVKTHGPIERLEDFCRNCWGYVAPVLLPPLDPEEALV